MERTEKEGNTSAAPITALKKPLREQQSRQNMASELADLQLRQQAIVEFNPILQAMLQGTQEEGLLRDITAEDEQHLHRLETAATNFGVRVAPKDFTRKLTDLVTDILTSTEASDLEKLGAYHLLKQQQVICGRLMLRAAQIAKLDIRETLSSFLNAQAAMERQLQQVNTMLEGYGVAMLSSEEPAHGLFGRAREVVAMAAGSVLSKIAKGNHHRSLFNTLHQDHRKTMTLIREVQTASDPTQSLDLCAQLRSDLSVHAEAEENVVYAYFRQFDELRPRLENSKEEHDAILEQLAAMAKTGPGQEAYLLHLNELKRLVKHHVNEEEDELFALFAAHADDTALADLDQRFMEAKQQIQFSRQKVDPADLSA